MRIIPIEPKETYDWLLNVHYAKRIPQIMKAFGLYDDDKLVGVVTYGIPASPSLCMGICGKEYSEIVLELNRLCLLDNHKNLASKLVSGSIKQLPKPTIVVSYADNKQGHVGYVYQATNFLYTGLSEKRVDWAIKGLEHKHSKTISDGMTLEKIKEKYGDDFYHIERSRKHRYIIFHGSKNDKKILKSKLKYKTQPYPKGKTKQYEINHKPSTQIIMNF
jgi:hypothetical protein